jgi:hypothetical protein
VVVGHSFGGAEAVTFAFRYADQVSGLVLIDASPASWPTELCAVADDGSEMAATIDSTCSGWTDPTANAEHLDVFAAFNEVAGISSLGSLPMTVITAVDRQLADLGATELTRLTAAWDQGEQRWADLSTSSQVVRPRTRATTSNSTDPPSSSTLSSGGSRKPASSSGVIMHGRRTTESHAGRTGRPVEGSHEHRRATGGSPDDVDVGSVVLGDEWEAASMRRSAE